MRIRQKLLLGFVGIALLVAVVGYASGRASQQVLCENIGQSSAVLAAKILEHIDEQIQKKAEVFQEYSADSTVRQFVAESNQEFEDIADTDAYIKETDRQWVAASEDYITPFMQNLIDNELSEKLREKAAFYNAKYGSKTIGEIFVTNKHGVNAAQSKKTSDYLQADEQWWQDAKQNGLAVMDVDYDLSSGIYSIAICTRIDDDAGNFLGVMKAVVNINEIIAHIQTTEKEEPGIFKLLTKDGRIIYATKNFKLFGHSSNELLSHFYEQKKHKLYAVITTDEDKEEKLIAHAHSKGYKDYKGLGWFLVIEYKTKDIFAPVAHLQTRILTITAVIMIFVIVFGLLVSSTISKSIGNFADIAEKISRGHLDSEIAERKKAQAKLQESREQLEKHEQLQAEHLEQIAQLEQEINSLLAELGREPEYHDIAQNQT
ncbi:MAG: hypothetical protein A2173_08790 [Planctomycetes bacterium RBG_13_44_8b]|nr:MAG: hypothetical protein A2173_08790 [Planctomycetes bacterium RBG_13_44_8b]